MVLMAISSSTESTASVCHELFIGMRKIPALASSKQPLVRIEELSDPVYAILERSGNPTEYRGVGNCSECCWIE